MKISYPIPEYLPDQTPNSGTMVSMVNGIPIVDGYSPVRGFQSISEPITGSFLGGAAVISNNGTSFLLVGTSTSLLRYSSGAWTTLVTGLTITEQWRFEGFGDFVVAVNGQATYEVDLVAGTASVLANAPTGTSVTVVGDYAVIGQTATDITAVSTSDINNHRRWVPDEGATVQPQLVGGEVMGLAGGEYGVILQRRRIVRQTRTGDATLPFEYDSIIESIGCASRGSVVQLGRNVYFLSDQGFMSFQDGQALNPIGSERVDRTFQKRVPPDDYERIFSAIDPVRKLVIWCIPGSPGFLFIYNYDINKWGFAEMDVEGVFSAFTSSETLEGVSAIYPDLDAMPVSLDDPIFSGGHPQLYIVSGGRVGTLSGETLKAVFEMGYMEPTQGRRSRVRHIRPITDAVEGQGMTVAVRDRQGDAGRVKTGGPLRDSGRIPFRASGRYHRMTHEIAAGSDWNYVHGYEVEYAPAGER